MSLLNWQAAFCTSTSDPMVAARCVFDLERPLAVLAVSYSPYRLFPAAHRFLEALSRYRNERDEKWIARVASEVVEQGSVGLPDDDDHGLSLEYAAVTFDVGAGKAVLEWVGAAAIYLKRGERVEILYEPHVLWRERPGVPAHLSGIRTRAFSDHPKVPIEPSKKVIDLSLSSSMLIASSELMGAVDWSPYLAAADLQEEALQSLKMVGEQGISHGGAAGVLSVSPRRLL